MEWNVSRVMAEQPIIKVVFAGSLQTAKVQYPNSTTHLVVLVDSRGLEFGRVAWEAVIDSLNSDLPVLIPRGGIMEFYDPHWTIDRALSEEPYVKVQVPSGEIITARTKRINNELLKLETYIEGWKLWVAIGEFVPGGIVHSLNMKMAFKIRKY